jgi:uncharacterized protein (DUF433 family)
MGQREEWQQEKPRGLGGRKTKFVPMKTESPPASGLCALLRNLCTCAATTVFDFSTGGAGVLTHFDYPFLERTDMHRLRAAEYVLDVDPREQAIYTPADAAYFLGINPSTLATWIYGRRYPKISGPGIFKPLIEPADPKNKLLSFFNLAEAHVLAACRYKHNVSIKAIRQALETLTLKYPSDHPLISQDFFTNGKDLFIKTLNENENLSTPGQLNLKKIMDTFLAHIGRDRNNVVDRVYPIIEGLPQDKTIVIIHGINSSQPVIAGRSVPVWVVYGRHKAGEKKASIARDFGLTAKQVNRAVAYAERAA